MVGKRRKRKYFSKQQEVEKCMDALKIVRAHLYNFDYTIQNKTVVVTAMEYHSYDLCIGQGVDLESALINLKPIINVYDEYINGYKEHTVR